MLLLYIIYNNIIIYKKEIYYKELVKGIMEAKS